MRGWASCNQQKDLKNKKRVSWRRKHPPLDCTIEILPKSPALRVKTSTSAVIWISSCSLAPQISNLTAFQTTAWANSLKSLPQSINQLTSVSLSVHTHTHTQFLLILWRILTNTHLSRILNVKYSLWKTDFWGALLMTPLNSVPTLSFKLRISTLLWKTSWNQLRIKLTYWAYVLLKIRFMC